MHVPIKKTAGIGRVLLGLSFPIGLEIPSGMLAWFALVPMFLAVRTGRLQSIKRKFHKTPVDRSNENNQQAAWTARVA